MPRGPYGQTRANLITALAQMPFSAARGSFRLPPLTRNRYLLTMHHWFAQILLARSFCSGLSARIGRILLGVCFAAL